MERITRLQFIAGMQAVKGVQSAKWARRVDKKVRGIVVAEAGDIVTMQFIPKINPRGTKNWSPVDGGQCFGVETREQADAIKRRRGLVGVLKMSETDTSDTRAVPRTIPVFDVTHWKAEGIEYEIVG